MAAVAPYDAQPVKHNQHDVDPADPNLYQALRDAGYHVMGCGKFDLLKGSMDWGESGFHGQGPDAGLRRLGFTDGIDNAGKHDFVTGYKKGCKEPFQSFLRKHGLLDAHLEDYAMRTGKGRTNYTNTAPTPLPDFAYGDNWIAANGMKLLDGATDDERAYYHCPACNAGFHPRDRALGIEGTSLSPGVVRMTGLAAARASFAETGTLLHDLAGVNVDAKQAEHTAEALGRGIAPNEREVVAAEPGRAPTMYLGMDGTGVPVRRAELAGRAGKQADGSARTREAKLVAVWAGAVDARGRDLPEREPGSVSYSAAVESAAARDTDPEPSPFARRVEREARRRGFDRASRQVVIGDGAPWIWNIADMSFPDAVQIVDLFHAKQHLWDVAKAIYGPGTDTAERWAKRRRDELDDGRIGALLAALRRHEGRDVARRCIGYVRRNRHRMQYPKFRAMGLCVGSGVVEAGCKHVLGTRCKRPGMHWSVNGVNAIAALRCCVLSNRFDSFWQRRRAANG